MFRGYYGRNLRTAIGVSGGPYGYTLATWTTGSVLINYNGIPSTLDALMFMAGAVTAFALVGTIAFGGVSARFKEEPRESALWGNFHFLSVGLSIGAAALLAHYLHGRFAWPLISFVSTIAYLLALGVELTAADERDLNQ
ncbi:MAG: hypothetical protein H0W54_04135 [Rubrobacter sp.]|nr:hypothetical protein [Rubrobacter sp.]MDQ3302162.1 hypothetical protein [Actinomycetota bacterium]